MRILLPLLAAAAVAACSSPAPLAPSAGAQTPVTPAAVAGQTPAAAPGEAPAAPGAAAPAMDATFAGTVTAPMSYSAVGEAPARYLLALKDAQKPMANTEVFLTDAQGNALGITGKTDANGHYSLTISLNLAGKPLVINAKVLDAYGRAVTLKTIAKGKQDVSVKADVDFGSTLATDHALADKQLTDFSEEVFAKIVARLEATLSAENVADFNLTNLSSVLRELADIVDNDAELKTQFDSFGEGDASKPNNSSGGGGSNSNTADEPVVLLNGKVQ